MTNTQGRTTPPDEQDEEVSRVSGQQYSPSELNDAVRIGLRYAEGDWKGIAQACVMYLVTALAHNLKLLAGLALVVLCVLGTGPWLAAHGTAGVLPPWYTIVLGLGAGTGVAGFGKFALRKLRARRARPLPPAPDPALPPGGEQEAARESTAHDDQ